MCYLCIEYEKQRLTSKEAFNAIGEMISIAKDMEQIKHLEELSEKILQNEVPTPKDNADLDTDWWNHTYNNGNGMGKKKDD